MSACRSGPIYILIYIAIVYIAVSRSCTYITDSYRIQIICLMPVITITQFVGTLQITAVRTWLLALLFTRDNCIRCPVRLDINIIQQIKIIPKIHSFRNPLCSYHTVKGAPTNQIGKTLSFTEKLVHTFATNIIQGHIHQKP